MCDMSRKQDDLVVCGRRVRVTPESLFISQEFAASSFLPMELCEPQRSAQWLQLQSRPDLSYEVNRAAQRSSAPTIANARALSAVALKAQLSWETTLRYPRGVIDVSTAQLVTYGDASLANMEGQRASAESSSF